MGRSFWAGLLVLTLLGGGVSVCEETALPGAEEVRHAGFPFPVGGKTLASGRKLFEQECASCHGHDGVSRLGGDLHLEADYTLGTRHSDLYRSVMYGVPGVREHDFSGRLNALQGWELTAYLMSLVHPPRTVTSPTGLQSVTLRPGTGPAAANGNRVVVQYTGWLTDGTPFDSSYGRSEPFEFLLGARQVIPGWDEGVKGMQPGELRQLRLAGLSVPQ